MNHDKRTGMRTCECGSFWGPGWDHTENCARWPGSEWARDHGARLGVGTGSIPKTRAAFRNRAGVHEREEYRRWFAAYRIATYRLNHPPKPKPVGVLEPTQGRALLGLAYRVDPEGTDHTRRRFTGGPYKPSHVTPAKRRKRRRH